MSDFCEFQKPCSHKSNGRNLPGCFCPLPDLPAQHHLFLHDGKEFLRGLSPATPDPGCSMETANVKCLAGVLLLPHAGCYERDDSVVALVAPAGESPVPGLISKDALLHPVQEARCQAFSSGYTAVLSRQCPVPDEKTIGSSTMECILSFVTPQEPGFSPELLKKSGVSTAVCAHVGMARGILMHMEMAHLLFQRKDGLFMVLPFLAGRAPSEAASEKDDHGRYRKGDV